MKRNLLLYGFAVVFSLFITSYENDEPDKASLVTGLWIQEKITEDGVEIPFSSEESSLSLLVEPNGVYRTYAKNAAVREHYGAWTLTDNTWFEFSADMYRMINNPVMQSGDNQWAKNHSLIRFTLLELSDNRLEIRLKTAVGTKKYSALFAEGVRPLITADNFLAIDNEFKTQKTYIFTFIKK
jgi:hypothetical protein